MSSGRSSGRYRVISFYNHFVSKEASVEAFMEEAVESFGDAADRLAETITDPAEVVAASVRHVVDRASGRLHGEVGDDAPERAAAVVLRLLGLPAKEAERVANRPLPQITVPEELQRRSP